MEITIKNSLGSWLEVYKIVFNVNVLYSTKISTLVFIYKHQDNSIFNNQQDTNIIFTLASTHVLLTSAIDVKYTDV